MLFNYIVFLIFFPAVVFIYFLLSHKYRWLFPLFASYYFYMCWKAEYLILILISTIIDYFAAIQMSKQAVSSKRKMYLILSLFVNLGLLFGFKYFNFFNDSRRIAFQPWFLHYISPCFFTDTIYRIRIALSVLTFILFIRFL